MVIPLAQALPAMSIQGTVTDTSGTAVANTLVALTSEEGLSERNTAITDANGHYRIELQAPTTAISDDYGVTPTAFELHQNWPNPFNPSTILAYTLAEPVNVELAIYNMLGQRVRVIDSGLRMPRLHQVPWDGRDDSGFALAAGVYLYRLQAGGEVLTRKMLMVDGTAQTLKPTAIGVVRSAVAIRPAVGGTYKLEVTGAGIRPHTATGLSLTDGETVDIEVEPILNSEILASLGPITTPVDVAQAFEAMGVRISDDPVHLAGLGSAHANAIAALHAAGASLTVTEIAAELAVSGVQFNGAAPTGHALAALLDALVAAGYEVSGSPYAALPLYLASYPDGSLPVVRPIIDPDTRLDPTRATLVMLSVQAAAMLDPEQQSPALGKPTQGIVGDLALAWTDLHMSSGDLGEDIVGLAGSLGGGFVGMTVGVAVSTVVTVKTGGFGIVVAPYFVKGGTVGGSVLGSKGAVTLYRWMRGTTGETITQEEADGVILTQAGVEVDGEVLEPEIIDPRPELRVSTKSIAVQGMTTATPLHLTNGGDGILTWTVIVEGGTWLGVTSEHGDTGGDGAFSGSGPSTLTVHAGGMGLADGVYEGIVRIASNGGDISIPVVMIVGGHATGDLVSFELPGGAEIEMVWIEPGTFMMGAPESDDLARDNEKPLHYVTLTQGFWLGKHELTQGQWESVMGTAPWSGEHAVQSNPHHPAVWISWDDVQELLLALNAGAGSMVYTIPTEAEWEYACRAGTTTRWSFADSQRDLWYYAWYRENTREVRENYSHQVGMKLPNPWGFCDMHGNVWEWVQRLNQPYTTEPQVDPAIDNLNSYQGIRGGGFWGDAARETRSAYRSFESRRKRLSDVGVRLLRIGGARTTDTPELSVAPAMVTVSDEITKTHLELRNSGTGYLHWRVEENETWLRVSSSSRDTDQDGQLIDTGDVTLQVTTAGLGLPEGAYETTIEITSNGGALSVPVTMVVGKKPSLGDEMTVTLPGGATIDFVWIEPGAFMMGSPESDDVAHFFEKPQHEVTLTQGFWLGKHELTQGQWESVMGTAPWSHLTMKQLRDKVRIDPYHPAVWVSWKDAQELLAALNTDAGWMVYRLPTEAEWEYACRAGTTTRWSFGDDESELGDYAWYRANASDAGLGYAQPVGMKLPNPWGLHDMHGNVSEWIQDWITGYPSEAQVDPIGLLTGSSIGLRGGNLFDNAQNTRSAYRDHERSGSRAVQFGVRLLRME